MGRLCHRSGDVGFFAGGELYRSHEEREAGFRSVIRSNFPGLNVLPTNAGLDDPQTNFEMMWSLLKDKPNLVGICCIGGGNRGIEKALIEYEGGNDVVYCAFNLTPLTRQGLLSGTFDAVVHQDMRRAAHAAIDGLINSFDGKQLESMTIPTEIIMVENLR